MRFWPFNKQEGDEERATLRTPTTWLVDSLGAAAASSGISVSESSALKYSAVYAAVRLLSQSVASLPLVTYERLEAGKRRAREHPVAGLLATRPSGDMSAYTFRETLMAHVLTHGNGYAEIVRNGAGEPVELNTITPDRVQVERDDAGTVEYVVDYEVRLAADSVLHVAGLGFDGLIGYSPITMARECIGLGLAAEQFGGSFFSNGARPGGVLEHPGALSQEAAKRLRESWSATYEGSGRAGRTAILEEGMKWQGLTLSQEDAQYLETRQFQVVEIARWYGVPPHLIGSLERATFSNIEHQSIEFVTHSLRPWLVRWEQEIARKLFEPGEAYYAEHLVDGLLRGDTRTRYESYRIAREAGWLSVNEIRGLENMNPVPGGDTYVQPLNMGTVGQGDEEDAGERSTVHSWGRPLLADALGRAGRVQRAAEARSEKRKGEHFPQWRAMYREVDLPPLVAEILEPAVRAILTTAGREGETEDRAGQIAARWISADELDEYEAAAAAEVERLTNV